MTDTGPAVGWFRKRQADIGRLLPARVHETRRVAGTADFFAGWCSTRTAKLLPNCGGCIGTEVAHGRT